VSDLKPASQRVQDEADKMGLKITVKQLTDSTRTAEDAAKACSCTVAQIVK